MEKQKEPISRRVLFLIFGVSFLFVLILILACFLYSSKDKLTIEEDANAGSVSMTYTDDTPSLSISGASPVSDEIGMTLNAADQYFDFTVTTDIKDSDAIDYEIALIKDVASSNILDNNIRIYLEKENSGSYSSLFGPKKFSGLTKKSQLGSPKGAMVIAKDSKKKSSVDNYRLRIWLSDTAEITPGVAQNYVVKVAVYGKAK